MIGKTTAQRLQTTSLMTTDLKLHSHCTHRPTYNKVHKNMYASYLCVESISIGLKLHPTRHVLIVTVLNFMSESCPHAP